MEIKNIRTWFTQNSTTGIYTIDGTEIPVFCLEPFDAGFTDDMQTGFIQEVKSQRKAKTNEYCAIPTGKVYKLVMTAPDPSFMAKFSLFVEKGIKEIPMITGINGFSGVLIHPGGTETAAHQMSEACNMPALLRGSVPDMTAKSSEGWLALMEKIEPAIRAGTATYEEVRNPETWAAFTGQNEAA